MTSHKKNTDLDSMVESAERIFVHIENYIVDGNEIEADKLSKLYEQELENIFEYKGTSHGCFMTKLNFTKKVLIVDHPMTSLVERAFDSLSEDIKSIFPS